MSLKSVRVRFAPSPTGALHIGGIRTLLLNYFFAQQHAGKLILRIEDTDQKRFVAGTENYILNCLKWLNIKLDESPDINGLYAPYRQSERTDLYKKYIQILLEKKLAYYAFDTADELNTERKKHHEGNWQYDCRTRMDMRNSLTLNATETQKLIDQKTPYVIRIKTPENKIIIVKDLIRGDIEFNSNVLDDKVLIKADGIPTYHFAVVVDDYLMKISHVFRGEEWLPSAPIHQLLYEYFDWLEDLPKWIHLPLILKPDGNGKLSKRDGKQFGIPVYALQWIDNNDIFDGFKDKGFLPEALINFLMTISWNDGSGNEIFNKTQLTEKFDLSRLQHHAAKFDYEKAKWINHQHIKNTDALNLLPYVKEILSNKKNIHLYNDEQLKEIIRLTKDRAYLLNDFYDNNTYLFHHPENYDNTALANKWNSNLKQHIKAVSNLFLQEPDFTEPNITTILKKYCNDQQIKIGDLQLPLRIILVGSKFGIGVTQIIALIQKDNLKYRIEKALQTIE